MKISTKISVSVAVSSALLLTVPLTALAATAPALGAAAGYSIYGDAGVTNTGAGTHVWGNVGDNNLGHPGLLGTQVDGTIGVGAGVDGAAGTAYGALDAQGATGSLDLAGTHTVTPGVYTVGATTLNGTLTLDGAGVYIFRSSSSITTSGAGTMSLINGATACNVFWQIPTSMTIGTGAHIEGTIIAQTGLISLATGATLKGRALAHTQVTLDSNQITEPTCAGAPPPAASATLHVIKQVVNNNGGVATASDFNLYVRLSGTDVTGSPATGTASPGTSYTLAAGTYVVSEDVNAAYVRSFSGACDSSGSVTLSAGDEVTCTITNTDIAPVVALPATITVIKTVINDNGRTRTAASFPLFVNGMPVVSGVSNTFSAGTYVVSETGDANYSRTFSGDCDIYGVLNLVAGDNKTCTITNNDIAGAVVPTLPNTGLSPRSRAMPWDIFLSAGILMFISTSLVVALRKRIV